MICIAGCFRSLPMRFPLTNRSPSPKTLEPTADGRMSLRLARLILSPPRSVGTRPGRCGSLVQAFTSTSGFRKF